MPQTTILVKHFPIPFAMLIYIVYLTYCKICGRLQGYKNTDLASLNVSKCKGADTMTLFRNSIFKTNGSYKNCHISCLYNKNMVIWSFSVLIMSRALNYSEETMKHDKRLCSIFVNHLHPWWKKLWPSCHSIIFTIFIHNLTSLCHAISTKDHNGNKSLLFFVQSLVLRSMSWFFYFVIIAMFSFLKCMFKYILLLVMCC